jgi:anchored repeat-type ABC transporter ATP-binding subunit
VADLSKNPWHSMPEIDLSKLGENCGPECNLCDADPLLEVRGLSVAYGRNQVLRDVNLKLPPGKLVGLIGPNGAGKSTLLKAILSITGYRGTVTVGGVAVGKARRRLAYVPQKEEVEWNFPVLVEDVVMMGRYRHIGWLRRPGRRDREIVADCLEKVGMLELRQRQISQLSGGQQQRVFFARALAQEGDVILLDEPLTGIDTTSQEVIMRLLTQLRNAGKLILMATHDLRAAAEVCDNITLINRGIVASGTPREVFKPELLATAFGGHVISVGGGVVVTP